MELNNNYYDLASPPTVNRKTAADVETVANTLKRPDSLDILLPDKTNTKRNDEIWTKIANTGGDVATALDAIFGKKDTPRVYTSQVDTGRGTGSNMWVIVGLAIAAIILLIVLLRK